MKHFTQLRTWLTMLLLFVGVSVSWGESWQLISKTSNIVSGETYLIATNNKTSVYNGSVSSGHLSTSAGTLSGDIFTAPDDACEVTLISAGTNNAYYIQIISNSNYISATATKSGSFSQNGTTEFAWTFADSDSGGFNVSGSVPSSGSVYFRSYNNSSFRSYSSMNGASIFLYKKIESNSASAITFANNAQGAFSAKVDGKAVASGSKVEAGKTVTLTAEPKDGYVFNAWNVYKTANQYNYVTVSESNTFTMPSEAVTVDAYFIEEKTIPNAQVSLAAGTYRGEQSVTITNLDEDEYSYYYTLDGTTPEIDGSMNVVGATKEYTGAISITESCTLSILTTDLTDSKVSTFDYVIEYPYTVTIEEPENGSLTVMYGETPVKSGDKFYKGDKITATATPADGYKFRNLQFTDASTHTFTVSNMKEWNMGNHDVTITATFDPIQYFTVTFSVNGEVVQSADLEEGATISVPSVEDINGKKFVGWVKSTAEVDPATAPTYETIGKATEDVIYYAVFATATGDGGESMTHTMTNEQVKSAYPGSTAYNTTYNTNDWTGKYAFVYAKAGPYYALTIGYNTDTTKGANNSHLTSPVFSAGATSIVITLGANNTNKPTFYLCDNDEIGCVKDGDEVFGKATVEDPTGSITIPITGAPTQFHIYVDKAVHINSIVVNYGGATTYSDFTTTPSPAEPTSTTITISAVGWTTFYDSKQAYDVPAGLDAYIVTYSKDFADDGDKKVARRVAGKDGGNSGAIDLNRVYPGGYTIPVGEAVLLKGAAGTYTLTPSEFGGDPQPNNMLHGTDAATELEPDDNYYFYALTLNANNDPNSVGFYWMKEDGVAFKNGAHKAYLMLPKEVNPVKAFTFEDLETAISSVNAEGDTQMYDLSGRKVSKAQKGLYIVNGKKYMVK